MTAASEGMDIKPVNENENDSNFSFGDDLDDNSVISSGDNSDNDPTDEAFVDASENENNNESANIKDDHTDPEGVDTDDALSEGIGSDTSEHDNSDGTDGNNNTNDTTADIKQQFYPSGCPMRMNRQHVKDIKDGKD